MKIMYKNNMFIGVSIKINSKPVFFLGTAQERLILMEKALEQFQNEKNKGG